MSPSKEKLLALIMDNKGLLSDEQIFNFYAETVMRRTCTAPFLTFYGNWRSKEHTHGDVMRKARQFYYQALGYFLDNGQLKIKKVKSHG